MKQFDHIGSLRHIALYLSCNDFGISPEALKADTETEKDMAHDSLYEWLEKSFPDIGAYREADDLITRCYQTYEQAAFEKGMKYGANLMLGLMRCN